MPHVTPAVLEQGASRVGADGERADVYPLLVCVPAFDDGEGEELLSTPASDLYDGSQRLDSGPLHERPERGSEAVCKHRHDLLDRKLFRQHGRH